MRYVLFHYVEPCLARLDPLKDKSLAFIPQPKCGVPHLIDEKLLESNYIGESSESTLIAENALEVLEGKLVQHPHNHWRADRIGQNTDSIEPMEHVPAEGLDTVELGAYDFEALLGGRLSVVEVETVLYRFIHHQRIA